MSGHTPGPWRLENRQASVGPGYNGRLAVVVAADGTEVSGYIHGAEEFTVIDGKVQIPEAERRNWPGPTYVTGEPFPYSANARLLSAALDLLEACKAAVARPAVALLDPERPPAWLAAAHAAIAKAEAK